MLCSAESLALYAGGDLPPAEALVAVPAVQAMGRIFDLFPSLRVTEMAVGFGLARFGSLPSGFALREVLIDDSVGPLGRTVKQTFVRPKLDAILSLGQTNIPKGTVVTSEGSTRIYFQWKGQAMSLHVAVGADNESLFPDEELIRLAASIR